MSDHNGDSRENHQRRVELHEGAAHAHLVASVAHEKGDHLTGHENSRLALEHSQAAHNHSRSAHADFGHDDIAAVAHGLWEARGCPPDSPEQDWFHATQTLRAAHSGIPDGKAGGISALAREGGDTHV